MTKIKESPCCPEAIPLLQRKRGHRLAVRVDARCAGACVLGLVFDVALTIYYKIWCDPGQLSKQVLICPENGGCPSTLLI